MAANSAYWQKRAEANFIKAEKQGHTFTEEVNRASRQTQRNIQARLEQFYGKYATNNEVTLTEARKLLSADELKNYKSDLNTYISQVKEHGGDPEWRVELQNQSIRHRVSRLEALQTDVKAQIENLYTQEANSSGQLLQGLYAENFLETTFDIEKGIGVGLKFDMPDSSSLKLAIETNWNGNNFANLWGDNKRKLERELANLIPQAFASGRTIQDLSAELASRMKVSRSAAERLVRTETSRISNQASIDSYKELDVTEYQILATLDNRTSEVCQQMDGSIIKVSEAKSGTTLPPFHPNCRTTTIPYFEDIQGYGERLARNSAGDNFKVPANMTYKQWKKAMEENGTIPKPPVPKPISVPAPWVPTPPVVKIKPAESVVPVEGEVELETISPEDTISTVVSTLNLRSLTEAELNAVFDYTTSSYLQINSALRDDKKLNKHNQSVVTNIDSAMETSVLPEQTLYRGTDYGLFGIEKEGRSQSSIEKLLKSMVGTSFSDKAYVSTTKDESTARSFSGRGSGGSNGRVILEIKADEGSHGIDIGTNSNFGESESEVLLPRDSSFVITGVKKKGLYTVIQVEYV